MSPRSLRAWTREKKVCPSAKVVLCPPGWNSNTRTTAVLLLVPVGLGKTACVQKTNTSRKALAELATLDAAGRRYGSAPLT